MRVWGYLIFTLLSIGVGLVLGFWWFGSSERQIEVSSQGVLQQVREVVKIATVEGQFSEIYDYKDFYYYDWLPLRKKALIKVSATVSMGYDLSDVEILTHEDSKEIIIKGLPSPSILSKDIQHEYYDLQEGSFNAFQPKDLNKMQRDIRQIIQSRVEQSSLPDLTRERFEVLLDGLKQMILPYGWSITLQEGSNPVQDPEPSNLAPQLN